MDAHEIYGFMWNGGGPFLKWGEHSRCPTMMKTWVFEALDIIQTIPKFKYHVTRKSKWLVSLRKCVEQIEKSTREFKMF